MNIPFYKICTLSIVLLILSIKSKANNLDDNCTSLIRIAQLIVENNDALIDLEKPKPVISSNTLFGMPINEEAVYPTPYLIDWMGEQFFYLIDNEGIVIGNKGTFSSEEASKVTSKLVNTIKDCLVSQEIIYQLVGDNINSYFIFKMPNEEDVVIGVTQTDNDSSKDVTVLIMSGNMLNKMLGQ